MKKTMIICYQCSRVLGLLALVALSLVWNVLIATAANLAPGDRQQLDTRSRETGTHYTSPVTQGSALNDSRATPATPPTPPAPGSAPLPPLPREYYTPYFLE